MKPLYLFLLAAVALTSCLQKLDENLVSNPLDRDYELDYLVIDQVTFKDTSILGEERCYPVVEFHFVPETFDRLTVLDRTSEKVKFQLILKRTRKDDPLGYQPQTPAFVRSLDLLEKDTTYKVKYLYWNVDKVGDIVCPEAYFVTESPLSNQLHFIGDTSRVQVFECFPCGG